MESMHPHPLGPEGRTKTPRETGSEHERTDHSKSEEIIKKSEAIAANIQRMASGEPDGESDKKILQPRAGFRGRKLSPGERAARAEARGKVSRGVAREVASGVREAAQRNIADERSRDDVEAQLRASLEAQAKALGEALANSSSALDTPPPMSMAELNRRAKEADRRFGEAADRSIGVLEKEAEEAHPARERFMADALANVPPTFDQIRKGIQNDFNTLRQDLAGKNVQNMRAAQLERAMAAQLEQTLSETPPAHWDILPKATEPAAPAQPGVLRRLLRWLSNKK